MRQISTALIFLLIILVAAACTGRADLAPLLPTPSIPAQTATFTVPPLPSSTTWATKTPRPTYTPTATPLPCWQGNGKVIEDQIASQYQPDPLKMLIYLPTCYQQQPERTYPALYLIHGQSFTPQQWLRLGVTALADEWISGGEAPPFIIIMPQVDIWEGPSKFKFDQIIMEEVLPYIEGNYRASAVRADRAVGGISRGASWALHLGLSEWQTFSAFGGHSLPVFYDDAPYLPYWLNELPAGEAPRIYVDYAESDQSAIRRSASSFMEQLDIKNIPYTFSTGPGTHTEEYWGAHIEEYLRFYLAGW